MPDIIIFFDNIIESAPKAISCIDDSIQFHTNIDTIEYPPTFFSLGYEDALESIISLRKIHSSNHKRIELLHRLNIRTAKGEDHKKWNSQKSNVLKGKIKDEKLLMLLSGYENGKLNWDDISDQIIYSKNELIEALSSLIDDLSTSYHSNEPNLKEWLEYEFTIDQYFLDLHFEGVLIDVTQLESFLHKLNKERFSAALSMERDYLIDLPGQIRNRQKVINAALPEFCEFLDSETELWTFLKDNKHTNLKVKLVLVCIEATIQYGNLIKHYIGEGQKSLHLTYNTMGSASGRIFVENPGTQYLKKEYRSIFIPNENTQLKYFDYTSFEPGIAFALSGDEDLIELYNAGDVYEKISEKVFSTNDYRDQIKSVLLMKIYGMKNSNIPKVVKEINGFSITKVIEFLDEHKKFKNWITRNINHAKNKQSISSTHYKREYFKTKQFKIETSAVNHLVQSTGSTILKKAILELMSSGEFKIILPLHDALLIEIKNDSIDQSVSKIKEQMEKAYIEVTKRTASKIKVEEF